MAFEIGKMWQIPCRLVPYKKKLTLPPLVREKRSKAIPSLFFSLLSYVQWKENQRKEKGTGIGKKGIKSIKKREGERPAGSVPRSVSFDNISPNFLPQIYNMAQKRARKYSEKKKLFSRQVARQQGCKDCTLKSCHGRPFPKFSPDLCFFPRQLVNPPRPPLLPRCIIRPQYQ